MKYLKVALQLLAGLIVAVVMIDVIYHTFIFNTEEYKQLEEQPELLKLAPDWIRWLIHDIGKLL